MARGSGCAGKEGPSVEWWACERPALRLCVEEGRQEDEAGAETVTVAAKTATAHQARVCARAVRAGAWASRAERIDRGLKRQL